MPLRMADRCPIDEAIPSIAVFDRRIRSDRLIEVSVIIVGVPERPIQRRDAVF
jgi:hypothetical protein